MPFTLIRDDITRLKVDAIVNAANSSLAAGGGVCGAIFQAAGRRDLQAACNAIGHCDVGQAVITPGFRLSAKYVIHAVGPIWQGGDQNEEALLKSCYTASLQLAMDNGCASVAFPLISSGIYGYPKQQALWVATAAITGFLLDHDDLDVYLVIFDRSAMTIGKKLFQNIQSYIDDHYVDRSEAKSGRSRRLQTEGLAWKRQAREQAKGAAESRSEDLTDLCAAKAEDARVFAAPEAAPLFSAAPCPIPDGAKPTLAEVVNRPAESFSQMLLRLIDEKGLTDVQTYKRANLDRKLFSKLRKDDGYNPSKATALALAIALELNLDQTRDLLARAGYSLSPSSKADLIIEYFIQEGSYDIYEINQALFDFEQKPLGAVG